MVVATVNLWIPRLLCKPYLIILHHKHHWPRPWPRDLWQLALALKTIGLGLENAVLEHIPDQIYSTATIVADFVSQAWVNYTEKTSIALQL